MKLKTVFGVLVLLQVAGPLNGLLSAATALYVQGSANSVILPGQTIALDPNGYTFTATNNFDNGVSFSIDSPGFTYSWTLDFAAPNDLPLTVGSYLNATRYPFQGANTPELDFTGNGHGPNTLMGSFQVLELTKNPNGSIASFSADFVQFDEGNLSAENDGHIRYNSSLPLPEPAIGTFLACGLLLITSRRRRDIPHCGVDIISRDMPR